MEIGKKIKELRTAKGITQEALAAELNVSAQAVSKWECGVSTPDIQLLPAIAIYFGVTLDALFCLTDDDELDRIQNMIWDSRMLPQGQLEQAERFLNGRIDAGYRPGRCWCLLAQLHNHQARQHQELAADYARRSLALSPREKDAHDELAAAMGGIPADWNAHNHHRLIQFYQDFVRKNPDYPRGYLWLMDNLLADHRLTEAEKALGQMEKLDHSFRVPLYRGLILRHAGQEQQAQAVWADMERQFPEEWLVQFSLGDLAADRQQYGKALEHYRRAVDMQAAPRYVDPLESMAQVCEFTGDIPGAMDALRRKLEIYAAEWGFTQGETADRVRRELHRLERLLNL